MGFLLGRPAFLFLTIDEIELLDTDDIGKIDLMNEDDCDEDNDDEDIFENVVVSFALILNLF